MSAPPRPRLYPPPSVRFHGYLSRQLLSAFAFAVASLLFVALPGIVVSAVHKLPNVEPILMLRFLPLVLMGLAPYLLPLCFMLAVVAVYGRIAADREWIAMQMSGLWPMRFFVPAFAIATVLVGATYWMVSEELPKLKEHQKRVLIDAAASMIANLQPGRTSISLAGFYLKAADRDQTTGTFYDAYIRKPDSQDGQPTVDLFASAVDIRIEGSFLSAHLRDWEAFNPRGGQTGRGGEFELRVDLFDQVKSEQRDWNKPRYRTSSEIRGALRAGSIAPKDRRGFIYELHHRIAMSLAFYLFLGLGAPTGLLMRRGTQLGALAVAAGYGIVYYLMSMRLGQELGLSENVPVWVGPWMTIALGSLVAAFLLKRAIRR